ncbi:MAG: cytochrome C [Deltaproteobacteria bacterium]|nr:cytochrome C [Deltaproteobacteria bacterium]
MYKYLGLGVLVLSCLFFVPRSALARVDTAIAPKVCLQCHGDVVTIQAFADSVHGPNGCTSCHIEVTDLKAHRSGKLMPGPVKCARCHKEVAAQYLPSVHSLNEVGCADCHTDIHTQQPWRADKRKVVALCVQCHDDQSVYRKSIHGQAVLSGNQDAAVCSDCHGLHDIAPLGNSKSFVNRKFHTRVCLKCHANKVMMERNGVMTVAVSTYFKSYHGKNYRLGFPDKVAGCADCHTAHSILPADDPHSSVNSANLVKTCSQCHRHVTPLFTEFYPHADENDPQHYPVLYWTYTSMKILLAGVFAVFWLHTLLWMFRGFIENREKKIALIEGRYQPVPGGHKIFRRFQRRHIFLHLLVIISFLGLALTGLPLYFADQEWARVMMDFYGGPSNSGFIHRICAGITFVYFISVILMSLHFLFVRKDIKGNWLQRLFGPDSLCPNLRDIKDVVGMGRWFLFRGPKPSFERWTYWEKFDFLAVFWGMFAIGGSGLLLWFPSFFGSFLPGWMFNVATIIHSDEALLATGFIFTVHFFNTHGRPEKFPMDFVIFNGEITKEEFIEERGDQWRRLEDKGQIEQVAKARPSRALYDFIFKGFGFLALTTGISLLLMMAYAFLASHH